MYRAGRAKPTIKDRPKISQISQCIGQISWRFEIDRPKGLKEARRCRSVRKLLFPFARARAKCGRNGPSMHTHGGIRVRQTPKVLRLRSSFGRAGETKFALKWVGRTDRARNENRYAWTDEGRVYLWKSVAVSTASFPPLTESNLSSRRFIRENWYILCILIKFLSV